MKSIKVLFFWKVPERLQFYLRSGLKGVHAELIFPQDADEKIFIEFAPEMDILVGWRPSQDLLQSASKAKLLINPGAGIKHLIQPIKVLNHHRDFPLTLINGHGNSYFTAQHAVALVLSITNKVVLHDSWMRKGLWRRGDSFAKSQPVRHLRVGLLGYGAVNRKVHKFLSGFDVIFAALKRSWEGYNSTDEFLTFTPNELDTFLKVTDILVIAVPETSETEGLIGKHELELLGDQGYLVNIARGSVIDQNELYSALKENTIAGAALDVWYNYRPDEDEEGRKYPFDYPFHELENVVLSPHRGASPMDDLLRWDEVITNISKVANSDADYLNIVDLEREY